MGTTTTSKKPRRNLAAQEDAIDVLHRLVRDHQHPEEYPHDVTTGDPARYTWSHAAMGKALDGIMEAFGYVVTEIQ
jgi:hypothetical protein